MVWESSDGLLLIDVGGSTYQRLLRANLDPLKLRGIFLTHSHADHINGLAALECLAHRSAQLALLPGHRVAVQCCLEHMDEALRSDRSSDTTSILAALAVRLH